MGVGEGVSRSKGVDEEMIKCSQLLGRLSELRAKTLGSGS